MGTNKIKKLIREVKEATGNIEPKKFNAICEKSMYLYKRGLSK